MDWFFDHLTEILAVVFSLIYLFLSIKQNILLWPFGIISVILYMYVYFVSSFYADMVLQFFYLVMSIYGWYNWKFGKNSSVDDILPIVRINKKQLYFYSSIFFLLWIVFFLALSFIPPVLDISPSAFPIWDSFTTAGGIVGTWMLAKKIIEHWIVWIVVDSVAIVLYLSKSLFPTTILFFVFTIMAIIGYFEWKKELKTST
jgi:nicotinamide mononucleotide transporter